MYASFALPQQKQEEKSPAKIQALNRKTHKTVSYFAKECLPTYQELKRLLDCDR